MAGNIWHDWLRAKQRNEKLLEGQKAELAARINQQNDPETEIFDRLDRELSSIDQESRELIMLRFYSQMSFKEIAKTKKMPIGTVLSKVHRGLVKLRQLMEEYSHE